MNNKIELIIEEINNKIIPQIENNINAIANGGCGVFAYLLYDRLTKIGISCEIREIDEYLTGEEADLQNSETGEEAHVRFTDASNSATNYFKDEISGNIVPGTIPSENEVGWCHLMVLLKEEVDHHFLLVDGNGIRKITNLSIGEDISKYFWNDEYLGNSVDPLLIKQLTIDKWGSIWNKSFNPKQITKLEKIIEELV